tara:strand:+ start:12822 stop:13055 length:234 start_codon:yes stop_codon:yes gene_type:complete
MPATTELLADIARLDEPRFLYYTGLLPEEISALLIKIEDGEISDKAYQEIKPEINSAVQKLKRLERNYAPEDRLKLT